MMVLRFPPTASEIHGYGIAADLRCNQEFPEAGEAIHKYAHKLKSRIVKTWRKLRNEEGTKSDKAPVNGGICLGLTPLDAEKQMERAKGFEPSTFTLAT